VSDEAPQRPTPGHGPALMSTPGLLVLAVVAFVVELALFGGVGAIAHELVDGGLRGWVAGLAATGGVIVLWGLLLAPRAKRRLDTGPRLLVSAALCLGTAYGLVTTGHPWWGGFVGIAGVAVVVAQVALPAADGERA